MVKQEDILNLGPLKPLVGIWESEKGDDLSPGDDRNIKNNKYREKIEFVPTGRIDNHEQILYGLRYKTTAWRLGEPEPFHEELGYWLWDSKEKQVLRCFLVPRGISIIAGGTVEENAQSFHLLAEVGSDTYGICSNKFLDKEFKTVRYELKITIHGETSFSYDEDTQMKMPGKNELFHHTDKNTLKKIS
ncbi:MAG: FABP family protein [Leptospiraceae bacterium]|nr:FABP family protein [Leptospiraceae bacterium]MCP5496173.1 FABP family protein [Leptospiraceae bacterium]